MRRKQAYIVAVLVATLSIGLYGALVSRRSEPKPDPSLAKQSFDADLIARGEYLARAADCVACHTAKHGQEFAGGLAMASPLGTIYSTNITPDPEHGIGNYSESEFSAAVRRGLRRDGAHLYPAMPFPDYARASDTDIHEMYAYFMKGVAPVAKPAPQTALMFPLNQRWGLALWNAAFVGDEPFVPSVQSSDEINRGKYLVETLGHCGSCHTPRGVGMQQKSLSDRSASFLAGGTLNGWPVPALRGLPGWNIKDVTEYLETGRNDFASVAGEMADVVAHSTQYLRPEDTRAIAAYLISLAPGASQPLLRDDAGAATRETTRQLVEGRSLSDGQRLYLDNCEACHFKSGNGAKGIFPRLNGGSVVISGNPTGLITVILQGAQTPSTTKAPSVLAMPGFAHRLSDQEVASLATFLRSAWGNAADAVSAKVVADVRRRLDHSAAD